MRVRLPRPVPALILSLVCVGAGVATPATAAVTRTRVNVVSISGTAGDPVTGGRALVWHSGADQVSMRHVGDGVEIRGSAPGRETVVVRLFPRVDQQLTYGQYASSSPRPSADAAGMSISVGGRTCTSSPAGRFDVHDVTADLSRLWLTFEQRCGDNVSVGEIRIAEDEDPDVLLAPSRIVYPDLALGSEGLTVPVTVVNTGSRPLTVGGAAIAGEPTKTPLSPIGDDPVGVAGLASFAVSGSTCGTLAPRASCVVLVSYRPLFPGPVAGRVELQDSSPAGRHSSTLAANATY